MRARREDGLTLLQLLFVVALIWGAVVLVQSRPAWLSGLGLFERTVGARAYFNHVLDGVEKDRSQRGGEVPESQACAGLTFFEPDPDSIYSCQYISISAQGYYTLTVVGKSGEVFRYAGRGGR